MLSRKIFSIGVITFLAACSNSVGPESGTQVSLAFATRAASATAQAVAAAGFFGAPATQTDGALNELIIERAQVVLREIELKRVEVVDCDALAEAAQDQCEEFETGPTLVDLPLDGVARKVAVDLPAGSYDEIEFDIHKVSSGDPDDDAFLTLHPEFDGLSIMVEGTYNGNAFVYTSDLDVEQEFDLTPPLLIGDNVVDAGVTIFADVTNWFLDGNGELADPSTGNKGEVNEGWIKENIKTSFEAFEDNDEDGHDDHDGGTS